MDFIVLAQESADAREHGERMPIRLAQFGYSRLTRWRPTMRRSHDDRPARDVKACRAPVWRTVVAFHNEFRVSPKIAAGIMFRNKISETPGPGCLCRRFFSSQVCFWCAGIDQRRRKSRTESPRRSIKLCRIKESAQIALTEELVAA